MNDEAFATGRPVVFRDACVITVDRAGLIETGDVLVMGDTIAEVGVDLPAPPDAVEIDARGGILMPGIIDTHRHMWQAAARGYGDWALSHYFSFDYLQSGDVFSWYGGMRPKIADIHNPYSYTDAGDARIRVAASGGE